MHTQLLVLSDTSLSNFILKSKGKIVPMHAKKASGESTGIAPLILNLGARWNWKVNITPRPFYSRKRAPVPIECKPG
jgi:hypothetical protein